MTFEEKLKSSNNSVTDSRTSIFNLLKTADRPMGVNEIISQSPASDRSTVYRTIELFEELGIIKRVWFGFKSKIELSEEFEDHHHHIVCEKCGRVEKIDHTQLEKMITKISTNAGYTTTSHHIELLGLCRDCQTT